MSNLNFSQESESHCRAVVFLHFFVGRDNLGIIEDSRLTVGIDGTIQMDKLAFIRGKRQKIRLGVASVGRCGNLRTEQVIRGNLKDAADQADRIGIGAVYTGLPIADGVMLCADQIGKLTLRQLFFFSGFTEFFSEIGHTITSDSDVGKRVIAGFPATMRAVERIYACPSGVTE